MKNYFPVVAARRAASASLICAICVICGLSSALEISNSTNTPTTNAAAIYADITNVITTTTATCYYGTTDGGTSAASWAYSTNYADCTNGEITVTVTNLAPATWYYYRWCVADGGTNTNSTAWASTSSNLVTSARAPTNYPAPGTGITVIADTNGVLLSPSNFFGANGIPTSNEFLTISQRVVNAEGAIITNSGNIATNAQAIGALSNEVDNINSNLAAIPTPTNQIIVVDGTAYMITNAPASAGDVLVFDPATTTAYFSAQAGGGLTLGDVKNVEPLMTNSTTVAIGKGAVAATYSVAVGWDAKGSQYAAALGREAKGGILGAALGSEANGENRGVAVGGQAKGMNYGIALGHVAKGSNYAVAVGYCSYAISNSVALGAYVTNTIPETTRVRGDLYLDGGTKIYTRETFNSGEFSELATGGATAGTYPVFAIPLGGAWTDFEIKASTNNFTDLVYYYKSWTNTQDATRGDTNALCYFTDDHAGDVRVWNLKTQTNAISEMLISTNSEVEVVYFYPSHDCTIPWGEWMSSTNATLVWSYVRVDDLGFEMNASVTKQHWSPIRPASWDAARTEP